MMTTWRVDWPGEGQMKVKWRSNEGWTWKMTKRMSERSF